MADTEIIGIGNLRQQFGGLRRDMETRVARAMVVAGGQVLKAEAKAIAQANGSVRTRAMVKNIVIKREKTEKGLAQYHLGVRHGKDLTKKQKGQAGKKLAVNRHGRIVTRYVDDPYYWRWVELGHKFVPRASQSDRNAAGGVTEFTQRLRDGTIARRWRKYRASSITARRRRATVMVPPHPFIAPALERKRQAAIDAMGERLNRELAKAQQPK